jgi:hypothetical protein
MEMKTIILLFIFSPFLCFAQEVKSEAPAPAKFKTNDCPTWNKKNQKKSSKAAYFQYLRSPKEKENQQTTFNKPQKTQSLPVVQKIENTTGKRNLKRSVKKSNSHETDTTKEKVADSKPEKIKLAISQFEEKKVELNPADLTLTGNSKEATKDKNKTEDSKIKRKFTFMSRRTTKVRRHSNAKCPSF